MGHKHFNERSVCNVPTLQRSKSLSIQIIEYTKPLFISTKPIHITYYHQYSMPTSKYCMSTHNSLHVHKIANVFWSSYLVQLFKGTKNTFNATAQVTILHFKTETHVAVLYRLIVHNISNPGRLNINQHIKLTTCCVAYCIYCLHSQRVCRFWLQSSLMNKTRHSQCMLYAVYCMLYVKLYCILVQYNMKLARRAMEYAASSAKCHIKINT